MKQILIYKYPKITVHILALIYLWLASNSFAFGQSELTKSLSRKYQVDSDYTLEISNKFGPIEINPWDKNEITADIHIKVQCYTENQAQNILEQIEIVEKNVNKIISFHTNTPKLIKNIGKFFDGNHFEIHYKINTPKDIILSLSNKFGSIYIGDFNGQTNIEVSYDKLSTKKLNNENNKIKVSFGSVEIEEVHKGYFIFKYCKYSSITKANVLELENKYGNIEIGEIESIKADIAYSKIKIEKLNKKLDIETKYGSGNVEEVQPKFDYIEIDNIYGSFTIGFGTGNNFAFQVETRFGNFNNQMKNVDIKKEIIKNTSQYYEGIVGKGGDSYIKMKSSFGNVRFYSHRK